MCNESDFLNDTLETVSDIDSEVETNASQTRTLQEVHNVSFKKERMCLGSLVPSKPNLLSVKYPSDSISPDSNYNKDDCCSSFTISLTPTESNKSSAFSSALTSPVSPYDQEKISF